MNEEYIILRTRRPNRDPYKGTLGKGVVVRGGTRDPQPKEARLEVDVQTLDTNEAIEVRNGTDVEAAFPSMNTVLTRPTNETSDSINDDGLTIAWGLEAVGALESPFAGRGVKIAVLDTGIDTNHEAFRDINFTFKDFTDEGPGDENGHGTHCAGTIFGRDVDGRRIGIARGVDEVVIGKVLNKDNQGTSARAFKAIQWAAGQGAHIISMSLDIDFVGYATCLQEVHDFPIEAALSKALAVYRESLLAFDRLSASLRTDYGVRSLLVAGAGNDSRRTGTPEYVISAGPPAGTPGIVCVGALRRNHDQTLSVWDQSNVQVEVSAPGVEILSAEANTSRGLTTMSGTSMAAPHVTGVAALWAERLMSEEVQTAYRRSLNVDTLHATVIGRATRKILEQPFDPQSVGRGLVQAP